MVDKSWMEVSRVESAYIEGVESFIRFAINHGADPMRFICPCKNYHFSRSYKVSVIREHLLCDGINSDYKVWVCHGEKPPIQSASCDTQFSNCDGFEGDRLEDMIDDIQEMLIDRPYMFENFVNDAQKPLYAECARFTKMSAILKLYNLKACNEWTDASFSALLELLKEILLKDNCLPGSTYEAKKLLRSVGMEYEKIHACPNDCILYKKEYADLDRCPNPDCGEPRYKDNKSLAKVMWYFPIRPRFMRLFGNPEDAKNLIWHAERRVKDGKIRHPADCNQWQTIDKLYHEFGAEDRNLRLALSTDGVNPFGNQSTSHSTWPVMLINYNLPPSLCMKRKYMMLTMLISGPKQPGNDIDVYLAPLIDDLKDLWRMGIEVRDANTNQNFRLRAMLFCTINDFPALGNLVGYNIKGYKACPTCGLETNSIWLPHSRKVVYQEHCRWLEDEHWFRRLCTAFNGCRCVEKALIPLSGDKTTFKHEDIDEVRREWLDYFLSLV